MCQYFADLALCPSYARFPKAYVIHYMDDILIAYSNKRKCHSLYEDIMTNLPATIPQFATEKIQMLPLYEYLCYVLKHIMVHPQKILYWKDF